MIVLRSLNRDPLRRLHLSASESGYKGVSRSGSRRFLARFCDGSRKYLGTFETAVEAAVAYARHVQSLEQERPSSA